MKKTMVVLVAVIASLVLIGCGHRTGGDVVKTVFVPQANNSITAEVWVKAPSSTVHKLVGDTEQDVVCLEYDNGKIALPNRIENDGTADPDGIGSTAPDWVEIAVYHLVDYDTGKEIDYYKRRFARGK